MEYQILNLKELPLVDHLKNPIQLMEHAHAEYLVSLIFDRYFFNQLNQGAFEFQVYYYH